jgi:PLD-like domain
MKRVRLLTDSILANFANAVFVHRDIIYRLWIVAPWVGYEQARTDPILQLIDALRGKKKSVTIITRPPAEIWHADAIRLFEANIKPVVYYCANLHTKLYIMECDGLRSAILGSPNLTPRANTLNREIAVEFRTTTDSPKDDIAILINDLTQYASELRGISRLAN